MKRFGLAVLGVLALLPQLTLTPVARPSYSRHATTDRVALISADALQPLAFELNVGQTDPRVAFLARPSHYTLYLARDEVVLSPHGGAASDLVRLRFVGASAGGDVRAEAALPGKANYFIGNDPARWHLHVPTFARVVYHDVYPGIDVAFHGSGGRLEYDFIVAPGAHPDVIRLGLSGADSLRIDPTGDLVMKLGSGALRQPKPFLYQEHSGVRTQITGAYALNGSVLSFDVGRYDQTQPLVIDPSLFYSTYLGGSGYDSAIGITVDGSGNAYVTGGTESIDFPGTTGANGGGKDAFITKLDPTGSVASYSTYIGGAAEDAGNKIAIDATGAAYIAGTTASADFPATLGAAQTALGGDYDAFVAKLDPTGAMLVYATYLGGQLTEEGRAIAVDPVGSAYVTGLTKSPTFPTTATAFQPSQPSPTSAFMTKLAPSGAALLYSTYLAGGATGAGGEGQGIAVDVAGNAYVTGLTDSPNFPTTAGAFQRTFVGTVDAFVTKLDPLAVGAASLVYSTLLGGGGPLNQNDSQGTGIAVNDSGNAYVAGYTVSPAFPTTPSSYQPALAGQGSDGFVTELDPTASTLIYSTYLGGHNLDQITAIALDPSGNTYLTGDTASSDFPTTPGAFQTKLTGLATNAFVTKLDPAGATLVYSTYLGAGGDQGFGVAIDGLPDPNAYVVGFTSATTFPTTPGAFQPVYGGPPSDGFVSKIADVTIPPGATSARVTGGGTIGVVGGVGTFSLIVQRRAADSSIDGDVQYFNHASGDKVRSVTISTLTIIGNTATIRGSCTDNGVACTFTVNATDNGSGNTDTFTISVTIEPNTPGPNDGGPLQGGNIRIQQ